MWKGPYAKFRPRDVLNPFLFLSLLLLRSLLDTDSYFGLEICAISLPRVGFGADYLLLALLLFARLEDVSSSSDSRTFRVHQTREDDRDSKLLVI